MDEQQNMDGLMCSLAKGVFGLSVVTGYLISDSDNDFFL